MEEWARSDPTPSARRTYDGSNVAEVQADPEDSAISFTPISKDSPSTYANEMLRLCGSRWVGWPLRYTSSSAFMMPAWRRSRIFASRTDSRSEEHTSELQSQSKL